MLDTKKIIERGYVLAEEAAILMDRNLAKIKLIDTDGEVESPWVAVLDPEEYEDENNAGKDIHVVLANHALIFLPLKSWGTVLKVKHPGSEMLERHITKEDVDHLLTFYKEYEEYFDAQVEDRKSDTDAEVPEVDPPA